MQRSLKRQLIFGLAALAVVAFAGGAYAATQSSAPNTRQAFLNDVAKRLGVTPQQLTAALQGATSDQLQAAVQAGKLTQAQANALEQRLKQNGNAPLGFGFGLGPKFAHPGAPGGFGPGALVPGGPGGSGGPGGGPGGPGGPGGFGGPRGFGGGGYLAPFGAIGALPAAASYLDLTAPQLFQQLASGKSLSQIAASKGKTVNGLEDAMTTAMKTRLDKLVSHKAITAAQEKQILSQFSARLSQAVNQKGMPLLKPGLRFRYGAQPAPGAQPKLPQTQVPPAYAPPAGAPVPTA